MRQHETNPIELLLYQRSDGTSAAHAAVSLSINHLYLIHSSMKIVEIVLINYPTASQSAIHGSVEAMSLTNEICHQLNLEIRFDTYIESLEQLNFNRHAKAIILPPCTNDDFYSRDNARLNEYLTTMQQSGAVLASACVGAFILGRGGFLDNKFCTTHWRFEEAFKAEFPQARLNTNAIVVNDGSVITAGGRMAWLDLVFEIISLFSSQLVALNLSKEMVVDTGFREQRFYHQFMPRLDHGDEMILKIQSYLAKHYTTPLSVEALAQKHFVSTRTLQRRFLNTTGFTTVQYLQKVRLHNACQLLELTQKSISEISFAVGYQDISSFRKVFVREYGLTPGEFRKRFVKDKASTATSS